jgi:hypothetical protein
MERTKRPELMQNFIASLRYLLEGKRAESLAASEYCVEHFPDPEAVFYMARQLVRLGETERALQVLADVLRRGYLFSAALITDPWLSPLRSTPAGDELLKRSRQLEQEAELAFIELGGREMLGA